MKCDLQHVADHTSFQSQQWNDRVALVDVLDAVALTEGILKDGSGSREKRTKLWPDTFDICLCSPSLHAQDKVAIPTSVILASPITLLTTHCVSGKKALAKTRDGKSYGLTPFTVSAYGVPASAGLHFRCAKHIRKRNSPRRTEMPQSQRNCHHSAQRCEERSYAGLRVAGPSTLKALNPIVCAFYNRTMVAKKDSSD